MARPNDPSTGGKDSMDEIREWLDALEDVLSVEGRDHASRLLGALIERGQEMGVRLPFSLSTPYVNTIPLAEQPEYPGDRALERRIKSLIRWNAMAMVVRANLLHDGIGGHISSYGSAATLYEVGFNHFFHGRGESDFDGDSIYFQAHSSPGIYARAFLEHRIHEDHLESFRRDLGNTGLTAYPHPYWMPDFWETSTASLGLGAIMAIYQARFNRYLHQRGIVDTSGRHVWAFLGDGETDEPEALGAISLAARERLDNLIFVVNCNLQRADGPVRGSGKIIQELESAFGGAGWNVVKVIWGSEWDPLLEADDNGLLVHTMNETLDGEFQKYSAESGAYVREHFFGRHPETLALVDNLSDEQLLKLDRGGHDPEKVYAAYDAAVHHEGQPTVILAKTIKGYGLGEAGEGKNVTHQQKKLNVDEMRDFRDRFDIPIPDDQLAEAPFYRPPEDSEEVEYLRERRRALGGFVPQRKVYTGPTPVPGDDTFTELFAGFDREVSTTMAFVRLLTQLAKHAEIGKHVVPIVADAARTFGMESMFRQFGIYSSIGQLYEPVDAELLLYYKEAKDGQILEEGVNSAGAFASWLAAATSHVSHGLAMVPFYVFYSIFGFQRIGDLIWAAADMRVRGFLIGAVAGRTTLNGEGFQHQDGHSHLVAAAMPSCVAYDPAYGYEVAVIVRDGLRRMYEDNEDVFYYLTVYNENYSMPPKPEGSDEAILRGLYRLPLDGQLPDDAPRVQLLASGPIVREAVAAAELLAEEFGIGADVWSVTSFSELRRDGLQTERWNRLHPTSEPRDPFIRRQLADRPGPVVAASDYVKAVADQIRGFLDRRFVALGTDGYGRSDTRAELRRYFEVDHHQIAYAACTALAAEGVLTSVEIEEVRRRLRLDAEAPDPTSQ